MSGAGLLSRIAEVLFWTGRYVERADDTARMVSVYLDHMVAVPQAGQDAGCRALLAVLGILAPPDTPLDAGATLARIAYDGSNPSAIAGAIVVAHRGARSVREVISSEMWQSLNVTARGLPFQQRSAQRLGASVFFQFVRERSSLFFGLADATMSHDDAWRFLLLGRSVERADMTARLLLARMPASAMDPGWPMVLRACGAQESFIRSRGWASDGQAVAEFLLRDPASPRSVLHSLGTAEDCLAAIDPVPAGVEWADAARRPIGRLRTRLEYADPSLLADQLPGLLADLQLACRQATEAIAERYFTCEEPVAWEQEC